MPNPIELRKLSVTYTATLITPDGTDTGVYGDPCEPGHGETMTCGSWAPDWATWEVSDDPAYGDTDTYTVDDGDPVAWLGMRLGERLGYCDDLDSPNGYGLIRTVYASGATSKVEDSTRVTPAAHPHGFTADEITAAHAFVNAPR